jgi:hypothetical protein
MHRKNWLQVPPSPQSLLKRHEQYEVPPGVAAWKHTCPCLAVEQLDTQTFPAQQPALHGMVLLQAGAHVLVTMLHCSPGAQSAGPLHPHAPWTHARF